jgi:hypothetical protein
VIAERFGVSASVIVNQVENQLTRGAIEAVSRGGHRCRRRGRAVARRVGPRGDPARDAIHLRRIAAAREALERADQELRDAVAAALAAGDSWAVVGRAMGSTRQGSYHRFGRDASG